MIEYLIIMYLLFQNIVIQHIPFSFVGYIDEFGALLCAAYFFIGLIKEKVLNKQKAIIILLLLLCVLLGIASNIVYGYQSSISAIIRDIVGFLKFPVTFIAIYHLNISKKAINLIEKTILIFKIYLIIVFLAGLVSLYYNIGMTQDEIRYGIHPFMFLYTHPTYYTTNLACILLIINATGNADIKCDILVALDIVLGMRTKGLAFIAVYMFIKYGGKWLKRLKVLYWALILGVIVAISNNKLMTYASYSDSPRESLYRGAFQLVKDCFPLGGGFGTYASSVSTKFMSKIYSFIHIAGFYNPDGSITVDVGDAGLAYYIGQFGIIGVILFSISIFFLFRLSNSQINNKNNFSVNMFWILIAISIPSEAILVNNGFELAVIFVVICSLCSNTDNNVKTKLRKNSVLGKRRKDVII